jgi:hypothetical protein
MLGMLLVGIFCGFCLGMAIIAMLLESGKIKTALTILMVKKQYAEVKITNPSQPNSDLYYKQPPDKKTPNK